MHRSADQAPRGADQKLLAPARVERHIDADQRADTRGVEPRGVHDRAGPDAPRGRLDRGHGTVSNVDGDDRRPDQDLGTALGSTARERPHEERRRDERLARAVQPGDERPAEMRLEPEHLLARDDVGRYAGCAQPTGQKLALGQLLLVVDQAQAARLVVFDLLAERLRQLDEQLEPLRHQPHVAVRVLRHVAGEVHRRPSGRCSRRARGQLVTLDEHDLPSSERQVVGDRGTRQTAADHDDVGLPVGRRLAPARDHAVSHVEEGGRGSRHEG